MALERIYTIPLRKEFSFIKEPKEALGLSVNFFKNT